MSARVDRPSWVPATLLGLSLAQVALALYQWRELWIVRGGGKAVCALGETVNCETVWNLPLATQLHALTLLPVAGLGLLWALCATGLSVAWVLAERRGSARTLDLWVLALRLHAVVGVLACVYLASASFAAKVVCLTCLATYALTLAFAAVAVWALPQPMPSVNETRVWGGALLRLGGLGVASYLALLGPGIATPKKNPGTLAKLASPAQQTPPSPGAPVSSRLGDFLARLPMAERAAVADSVMMFRASPAPATTQFASRHVEGPANAPVKIVEFTDLLCGHCQALQVTLDELRKVTPPGSFSVEPRYFPLDGECNKLMTGTDGRGLRCLGAKVQLCLEGAPDFGVVRRKLFDAQQSLTKDSLWAIASSGKTSRAQLEACVASPATQARIDEDVAYAALFQPEGTPIILINGKQATPVPAFLYAMVMTGGNAEAPELAALAGAGMSRNR